MKCCDQYPNKQLVIYGEGTPSMGNRIAVTVCANCGALNIIGGVDWRPVDITFQITSRPALDAVSIPVRAEENRGKK